MADIDEQIIESKEAIYLVMPQLDPRLPGLSTLTAEDLAESRPHEKIGFVQDKADFSASLGFAPDAKKEWFFVKAPGTGFYLPYRYAQFAPTLKQMLDYYYRKHGDDGFCYASVFQAVVHPTPHSGRAFVEAHKDFITAAGRTTAPAKKVYHDHLTMIASDCLPTGFTDYELSIGEKMQIRDAEDPAAALAGILYEPDIRYTNGENYEIVGMGARVAHALKNPTVPTLRTVFMTIFGGPELKVNRARFDNPSLEAAVARLEEPLDDSTAVRRPHRRAATNAILRRPTASSKTP